MPKFVKSLSLLSIGLAAGGLLGVNMGALADRPLVSALPVQEADAFGEVFMRIKKDYVEPVEDRKLLEGAINGMVSSLDPHSSYLNKEALIELNENTQGAFGGLGMEVGMEDGVVRVTAPIEDTPAFKAGVKAGDYIIKIDNTAVRGLTLEQAVKRLRGEPGSKVQLTILRKGETRPLQLTLTRAIIQVKSVKFQLAEPGYGYVRITQFQEHTVEDMVNAINTLYKDNKAPLKGLVLDLRNDPGGLLKSAVGVSAAFLPKDALVVSIEGRRPESKTRLYAGDHNEGQSPSASVLAKLPAEVRMLPVVVLINGGSASASEIVAGALQDHKRAIIVGTQSFGKGSVQTVLPLRSEGAIKLTTARYFTPAGRSIQAKGISPDVVVEDTDASGEAYDDRLISEADLSGHLSNPAGEDSKPAPAPATRKAAPAQQPATDKTPRQPREPELDANGNRVLISKYDNQLKQAFTVLKVQQLLLTKPATASATPAAPAASATAR